MATERKLDIFRVLGAADSKSADFYDELSDEEKKAYVPLVTARWMSGTNDERQIMMINEFLNPYLFSLYKHPHLLWKLTVACNSGRKQRYVWNKLPSGKEVGKSNTIKLIQSYYNYNTQHAVEALEVLSKDDVLAIAADMGLQPDDIAKIKRELKTATADEPAVSEKKSKDTSSSLLEF